MNCGDRGRRTGCVVMLKDEPLFPSRGFWIALLIGLGLLAWLMIPPMVHGLRVGNERARLSMAVSNGKQIKLIMDSFAMDHNGEYPNARTASKHGLASDGSSNALFRQLIAGGHTHSENVFWIKGHPLCNQGSPDDVTTIDGAFAPDETLQPGDNGWAYVMNQAQTENPSRPLLLVSPSKESELLFDLELWNKKWPVVRIDGSAKPERLNPEGRLMDGDNKKLLTAESEVWGEGVKEVEIAYPALWGER